MEQENEKQRKDYGVILYENSNAKSFYDLPDGKLSGKAIAPRVYIIMFGAALFGWFLFSLITMAQSDGIGVAVIGHLVAFIVLVIVEFIIVFTAFSLWGKFFRAMLRNKALFRRHRMESELTSEFENTLKAADANKAKEYAIRIYKEYVVITNLGEDIVIHRSRIRRVKCDKMPNDKVYHLTFILNDDTEAVSEHKFPLSDVPIVKGYFDCFDYTPANHQKGYFKKKLPAIAFMCIQLLIGATLLIVRSFALHDMPMIFGLGFIALSILLIIVQFRDIAVVYHGIFPIGGGLFITALPIGIMLTIGEFTKMTVPYMLSIFTVYHAILAPFVGLGVLFVILGISGLVTCIRNGSAGAVFSE